MENGNELNAAALIERFYNLKEKGLITPEEFTAKKAQLLNFQTKEATNAEMKINATPKQEENIATPPLIEENIFEKLQKRVNAARMMGDLDAEKQAIEQLILYGHEEYSQRKNEIEKTLKEKQKEKLIKELENVQKEGKLSAEKKIINKLIAIGDTGHDERLEEINPILRKRLIKRVKIFTLVAAVIIAVVSIWMILGHSKGNIVQMNPMVGRWTEESSQQAIAELIFNDNMTFSVTWIPFETYKDYWGTYAFDLEKGILEIKVKSGNYIPPDINPKGFFGLSAEQKTLAINELYFGTRSGCSKKPAEYIFTKYGSESKSEYFSIQLGAFTNYNNANNYALKFKQKCYFTEITEFNQGNSVLYRVRLGKFDSLKKALQEKTILEGMENANFTIFKPNGEIYKGENTEESNELPSSQELENIIWRNLGECPANDYFSFNVVSADKISKIQYVNNLNNLTGYIYFKLKKVNNIWELDSYSMDDDNDWEDADKFKKESNEACIELRKIENNFGRSELINQQKLVPINSVRATLSSFKDSINSYITDNSYAPDTESINELASILSPFYMKKVPLLDPWGNKYGYHKVDSDRYFVISFGPDKLFHTDDDISIDGNGVFGAQITDRDYKGTKPIKFW